VLLWGDTNVDLNMNEKRKMIRPKVFLFSSFISAIQKQPNKNSHLTFRTENLIPQRFNNSRRAPNTTLKKKGVQKEQQFFCHHDKSN
jgi:hypothetical protein